MLQQPRPWHSQPWLQLAQGCTSPPLLTAVLGALLAAAVPAAVMVQPTAPTFTRGTANACQGAVVAAGCSGGTLTFTKEFYGGQISLSALKDRGVQRGVFQCRESDSPLQCLLS